MGHKAGEAVAYYDHKKVITLIMEIKLTLRRGLMVDVMFRKVTYDAGKKVVSTPN